MRRSHRAYLEFRPPGCIASRYRGCWPPRIPHGARGRIRTTLLTVSGPPVSRKKRDALPGEPSALITETVLLLAFFDMGFCLGLPKRPNP